MSKFEIKMPKLGESITEGTIISWSVKVGDMVEEDDVLFEVSTAKVSAEIPSPVAGKILEILSKEGDTVAVGTVVAIVLLNPEEGSDTEEPKEEIATKEQEVPNSVKETPPAAPKKTSVKDSERWYSPVVLEMARQARIGEEELGSISGTGYLGRVSKRDMEQYIQQKGKATAASALSAEKRIVTEEPVQKTAVPVSVEQGDEVIAMDPVRRIIADRMVASKKTSPHVTNMIEVDVTKLVRWREQHKDDFKKREGISLTYMPAITEAVANALLKYPRVNSSVDGYNIIQKKHIHIGIAVSLENGNLIVPVVKGADKLNLNGLASTIATLADKARKNKLLPDDIQGGTFTITNFGSFKSVMGTPIINQPEVAILGVGMIEKKPAVIETPEGDVIAIRHKMYLSLSYDHRVVDGALGGNFLYAVARYLEEWKG